MIEKNEISEYGKALRFDIVSIKDFDASTSAVRNRILDMIHRTIQELFGFMLLESFN